MGRIGFFPLLALFSACFVDMSGTVDLAEAKAAFDAIPAVSRKEYEETIAQQEIRGGRPQDSASIPSPNGGIDQAAPVGEGAIAARLSVGQSCAALPAGLDGKEVLIVAAFADAIPEADLIFTVRSYQAQLAACVEQAGGRAAFQTRVSVKNLRVASEILIYTS